MTDDEMMFRALCESDGDHKSWVNMERIVAENKKLREALKAINGLDNGNGSFEDDAKAAHAISRAALGDEQEYARKLLGGREDD
jgi:hypothetical protein